MKNSLLRDFHHLNFLTPKGLISFINPNIVDLDRCIKIIQDEDLDTRRLLKVSHQAFNPISKMKLVQKWKNEIDLYKENFLIETRTLNEIEFQMNNILEYKPIPRKNKTIKDPFNMGKVEKLYSIEVLKNNQVKNMIIGKNDNNIISFGRLLEVDGNVELVSLWTHPNWRKLGIASKVIEQLISNSTTFPIFSFQRVSLISSYLRKYRKLKHSYVAPYKLIPKPLRRDLFYMNTFWGPYTIIRLG